MSFPKYCLVNFLPYFFPICDSAKISQTKNTKNTIFSFFYFDDPFFVISLTRTILPNKNVLIFTFLSLLVWSKLTACLPICLLAPPPPVGLAGVRTKLAQPGPEASDLWKTNVCRHQAVLLLQEEEKDISAVLSYETFALLFFFPSVCIQSCRRYRFPFFQMDWFNIYIFSFQIWSQAVPVREKQKQKYFAGHCSVNV